MIQHVKPIGILSGTFDPIHYGHLRLALELYQQLDLQEVRLIPCKKPVLSKIAQATAEQRLAMLKLVVPNQPNFIIDERELQRKTPSYTVDTLISLRQELGEIPLALILGEDAFFSLPNWHRWQELIKLTHFIVVPRPGFSAVTNSPKTDFKPQQIIQDPKLLTAAPGGYIFFPKVTSLAISSTLIRQQIKNGFNPRYLLPDAVLKFIQEENLYQKI